MEYVRTINGINWWPAWLWAVCVVGFRLFQKCTCITDQWRYSYKAVNSIDQLHCLGQHGPCLHLAWSKLGWF